MAETRRRIRSYVLRPGRITAGQRRAYGMHWQHYGLAVSNGLLDPSTVFGRDAPLVLEIGFGMGDSLAAMAAAEPQLNFIGIEVHPPGVGRLMSLAAENELKNLKIYQHDAVEVLEQCIAPASVNRLQVYFPDPWHKKKHHKRRLIQPAFCQLLASRIRLNGLLHLATDWENYAEQMLGVLNAEPAFVNLSDEGGAVEQPLWRPCTKFERRGERLGHGVWDLLFRRQAIENS